MGLQHRLPQQPGLDRRLNRKLAYSVTQAAEQLSVSRSTLYELAKADKVRLSKIGARTVIFESDLQVAAAKFRAA